MFVRRVESDAAHVHGEGDEIYITSAKDSDHGQTSHHYGLSYQG
jgi:hypothetical protein